MAVRCMKFTNTTKHGVHTFVPNVSLGFEDPDAVPHFIACGWGEETTEEPIHIYTEGEVDIDPATVHRGTGLLVADILPHGTPDAALKAGVRVRPNSQEMQVDDVTAESSGLEA